MTVAVRFAPSPSGALHVGNARTALVNWLFARRHRGRFVLRIDDTDPARTSEQAIDAIEADLGWLGLDWDQRVRQSARADVYAAAVARLREGGHLYEAAGEAGAWRFRLAPGAVTWHDLIRGPVTIRGADCSDPVVVRADGRVTYLLASIVDDLDLSITHVIRGEDHVTNTAVQLQIAGALGAPPQGLRFAHLPLLVASDGRPLAKRSGALALADLRADGIEPLAVVSLLARLGSADPVVPVASLDEAVAGFDLARLGRAPPRFDVQALRALNRKVLARLSFAQVAPRLAALGLKGADARFWEAVRDNLDRFDEVRLWWQVCFGPITPIIDDPAFCAAAARLLPPEPWDETTWGRWTEAVAAATGRRGRALYRPLRRALTGRDRGPEMKNLLPLIGRARALARLAGTPA